MHGEGLRLGCQAAIGPGLCALQSDRVWDADIAAVANPLDMVTHYLRAVFTWWRLNADNGHSNSVAILISARESSANHEVIIVTFIVVRRGANGNMVLQTNGEIAGVFHVAIILAHDADLIIAG
jgi:hypothetical protein